MEFRTVVDLPERFVSLSPGSRVMLLGSCFADHIGSRLAACRPDGRLCLNPHGTLYNPHSIRQVVDEYLQTTDEKHASIRSGSFRAAEGDWRHWDYATKFTAQTQDGLCRSLENALQGNASLFNRLDVLLITLSTDHVYRLAEGECQGRIVANCHKQPSRLFREEQLPLNECEAAWTETLTRLFALRSNDVKVVFTLSPYRYRKYGMVENARSKARLLLLIDSLCQRFENVGYFPAYEIVTDELRDYRFYKEDMLHPSDQAVDYVWERFREWTFTPEMYEYAREWQPIARALAHRPVHPESDEFRRFVEDLERKREKFQQKWAIPDNN